MWGVGGKGKGAEVQRGRTGLETQVGRGGVEGKGGRQKHREVLTPTQRCA